MTRDSKIVSIQVGLPRNIGDDGAADVMDHRWHSGFYKHPIAGPVHAGPMGLAGDGQADLSVHGGIDHAILAYCAGHYSLWCQELGLEEMPLGGFGENLSVADLDETCVCIGDHYSIGAVRVEVSQPRQPCWKLARRWRNKQLPALVIQTGRGGWYFRVIEEGVVEAGMSIRLLERPYPQWTISRANDVMYRGQSDEPATRELAACPRLADDWRRFFIKRLESHANA